MNLNFLKKVKQAGATEIIKAGTRLIDEVFTSKEEGLEIKKQLIKDVLIDRQGARKMFMSDSWLQKVFALFFMIIWAFLLYLLLQHFVFSTVDLEEWQIAFVNTIWGGVSMKLGTIVDFLFGIAISCCLSRAGPG